MTRHLNARGMHTISVSLDMDQLDEIIDCLAYAPRNDPSYSAEDVEYALGLRKFFLKKAKKLNANSRAAELASRDAAH